jgi:hypothetical protein
MAAAAAAPRRSVRITFRRSRNAVQVVEHAASPQLTVAAHAVAHAVPEHVPVHHGGAKRTYRTWVEGGEGGLLAFGRHPSSRVAVRSPFWHFLEYGTRFNPPYRPIERAVESLGLEYRPK